MGLGFRVPKALCGCVLIRVNCSVSSDICGSNHTDGNVRVLILIFANVRQGSKKTGDIVTSSFQNSFSLDVSLLFLGGPGVYL